MGSGLRSALSRGRRALGGRPPQDLRVVPSLAPGDQVVVEVMGGLGNQMFQYAAGRSAALRQGTGLALDTGFFATQDKQAFGLDLFPIAATVLDATSVGPRTRLPVIRERGYHYQPELWTATGPAYFTGYWQSHRYFDDVADLLRKEFRHPSPPALDSVVGRDVDLGRAASLHVRRGDYVAETETNAYHGTRSLSYYRQAMGVLRALAGHDVDFFVFSDDPAWAERELSGPGVQVVSTSASAPHDDLALMSQCRHHVLANSSFSWWGAWLSEQDGVTVAPRPWFLTPENNTKDLLPPAWLTIGD